MDYRTNPPAGAPPAIRNNNPGNIRPGDSWLGLAGTDPTGGFDVFTDMSWGARAMGQSLLNSWHGGNTSIRQIITAWAPSSDGNPVDSYVSKVASAMAIDPDQALTMDINQLTQLVRVMSNVEIGDAYTSYFTDDDLNKGLSLISSNVQAYMAAAIDQVKENPVMAIGIALAVAYILYLAFRKEDS